jgi:catechol 2,3-dioxygenase-like lactoylglutathione lyase family enzyme
LFDHGITHVCFQVDDLDSWHQRLTAAGVEFTSAPQTFGPVKNVYALDPDGNIVELIEPLAAGARLEVPNLELPSGFDPTTSVEGVHHVGISVASMAQATAFYENFYGLLPLGDGIDFSDGRFDALWNTTGSAGLASFINLGNAFLEVFDFENPSPKIRDEQWRVCDHGFTHFSFQLNGLAELYEELQAREVRFTSPPLSAPRVLANYSYDHDGNIIELFEPTEAGAMLSVARTAP